MCKENYEVVEIKLEDLVSFGRNDPPTYQGERLEQFMNSIEKSGLINPIIVRPVADGKYEILCGHNRVKAMRKLGRDVIPAIVKNGLSDDEAIEFFYDSNLNQQSFFDWSYSQKIEAVKYLEKLIKANSHQGKRTDLDEKKGEDAEGGTGTSVYSRQKLNENVKRDTTRDKMARRLGISTATLSKYRSIIKLPDDLIESIARLLDQKRISFEAAYRISMLRAIDIKMLVESMDNGVSKKIDMDKLKELCIKNKKREPNSIQPISRSVIESILISKAGSGNFKPIRRSE